MPRHARKVGAVVITVPGPLLFPQHRRGSYCVDGIADGRKEQRQRKKKDMDTQEPPPLSVVYLQGREADHMLA